MSWKFIMIPAVTRTDHTLAISLSRSLKLTGIWKGYFGAKILDDPVYFFHVSIHLPVSTNEELPSHGKSLRFLNFKKQFNTFLNCRTERNSAEDQSPTRFRNSTQDSAVFKMASVTCQRGFTCISDRCIGLRYITASTNQINKLLGIFLLYFYCFTFLLSTSLLQFFFSFFCARHFNILQKCLRNNYRNNTATPQGQPSSLFYIYWYTSFLLHFYSESKLKSFGSAEVSREPNPVVSATMLDCAPELHQMARKKLVF